MEKSSLTFLKSPVHLLEWTWHVDSDALELDGEAFVSMFGITSVPKKMDDFLTLFDQESRDEIRNSFISLLLQEKQEVLFQYDFKEGSQASLVKFIIKRAKQFTPQNRVISGVCIDESASKHKVQELNVQKEQLTESLNLVDTLYKLERNALNHRDGLQKREYFNLLNSILEYTDCEEGFIGEVVKEYGVNVLWDYASSSYFQNIFVKDQKANGEVINKLIEQEKGIGKCLSLNKTQVIKGKNAVSDFLNRKGLEWEVFIMIPIITNNEMVGMLGLLSKKERSLNILLKKMIPYVSCLSNIINYNKFDRLRNKQENELKINESRLKHFCDNINIPIMVIDPKNMKVVDCNSSAIGLFGYSKDEMIGMGITHLDAKYNADYISKSLSKVLKEKLIQGRTVWKTKNGGLKNILLQNSVIDVGGEQLVMTSGYEIPDYKTLLDELNLSQKITSIVVSSMDEGILIWDMNGKIVESNSYVRKVFGSHNLHIEDYIDQIYKNSQIKNIFGYPIEKKDFSIYKAYKENSKIKNEVIQIVGDQKTNWFTVSTWAINEDTKEPLYVAKVHDITLLKTSQDSLIESKKHLDLFFNQSLFGFFIMTLDEPYDWYQAIPEKEKIDHLLSNLKLTKVNQEMLKQKGLSVNKYIGSNVKEFFQGEVLENQSLWSHLFKNGITYADTQVTKEDGSTVWLNGDYGCIYDKVGRITGIFGIRKDITPNVNFSLEIEQQERKFKNLFENAPVGILTLNQDGKVTSCNTQIAAKFGKSIDEFKRLNFFELFEYGENKEEVINSMKEYLSDVEREKYIESSKGIEGIRANGRKFPVELLFSHFTVNNTIQKMVFVRDVSEKERAEYNKKLLNERETLLKEIHHRVKNNMQVVSSLLSLQASSIKDEEALLKFKESEMRIKTMALIHEQLYESNSLSQIDVNEYVRELTNNIVSSYSLRAGLQVKYDLDDLKLPIDYCIPFGLIVNEFITNAMKYAFVETDHPKLTIKLKYQDQQVLLNIKDNGIGLQKDMNDSRGLGMKLVKSLVKQLRGEYAIESNGGVNCQLTFKITDQT